LALPSFFVGIIVLVRECVWAVVRVAMDIHESGVVSGIGISPAARHVCSATLVYCHSATAGNIAKGYVVDITSAGGKSVVT